MSSIHHAVITDISNITPKPCETRPHFTDGMLFDVNNNKTESLWRRINIMCIIHRHF